MAEPGLAPPEFESDLFFTVRFPLPATPGNVPPHHGADHSAHHGDGTDTMMGLSRDQVEVLRLCVEPQPPATLMEVLGRSDRAKLRQRVLRSLINTGLLRLTLPDKPRSKLQRYVTTPVGREWLASER